MAVSSSQLELDLRVQPTTIEAELINHASESVRVWDRHNSWGWRTLALDVAESSRPEVVFTLTPKPRIWTKNSPGFVEIKAGERHVFVMAAGDPQWEGLERIGELRGETLRIRANLRIPPSPEAGTNKIFVGEVSSEWRESKPPHRWLFADA